jgi:hypothetical protein
LAQVREEERWGAYRREAERGCGGAPGERERKKEGGEKMGREAEAEGGRSRGWTCGGRRRT